MKTRTMEEVQNSIKALVKDGKKEMRNKAGLLVFETSERYYNLLFEGIGFEIYLAATGERFYKMLELRNRLRAKQNLLEKLEGRIYEIELD